MKIIVPMAGMGKRMRPHTLTVPKPLIAVAGKPIVQHLIEDLAQIAHEPITEVGFIIGRFGTEVEQKLIKIAESQGAKGRIFYQDEALGTAHAINCAAEMMSGKVIIAFADTLFQAKMEIDPAADGVIWVKEIEDPRAFGVVEVNDRNTIVAYHEKPEVPVSNLAMIGIYYFKEAAQLQAEINYLLDNNIVKGGEYQLPDAMRRLTEQGKTLQPGKVSAWLDCGNKNATVETNAEVLAFKQYTSAQANHLQLNNALVIEPCYIGDNVKISNSIVGPFVSIGANTNIESCVIKNSIVQSESSLSNAVIDNSMIGKGASVAAKPMDLSISDYSTFKL